MYKKVCKIGQHLSLLQGSMAMDISTKENQNGLFTTLKCVLYINERYVLAREWYL